MAKTKTLPDHKNVAAFCRHLAGGNGNAGTLLAQIKYWMPKATITHNGHRWIAKSLHDWAAETGQTHQPCLRAMALLRKRNLVLTERHWFGNISITHVRLTPDAITAFSGQEIPASIGAVDQFEHIISDTEPVIKNDNVISTENTEQGIQTEKERKKDCELFEPASDLDLSKQGDSEVKDPVAKENPETAEKPVIMKNPEMTQKPEITKKPERTKKPAMTCAQVQEKIHKPEKTGSLEQLWLATYAEAYGKFAPGFTMKQRGQLKLFVKKCPPATAESVVVHVVSHWPLFCALAEQAAGTKGSPAEPLVGYLLQHVGPAVNCYLDSLKPKAQPKAPTLLSSGPAHAIDCVAPKPTPPKPAKPKKLDQAETDAAWDDYFPDGKPKGC